MGPLKLVIIIPCFNENERLSSLLSRISIEAEIIVVDDGSEKSQDYWIPYPVHFLRLDKNHGAGYATNVGIQYAKKMGAEIFVTIDADGQHDPIQIPEMITHLKNNRADIVLGNRFASSRLFGMTWFRRLMIRMAAAFETFITGIRTQDAHNGFRCFNRRAADVMNLKQKRMAHATEIKQIIAKNRLRYAEYPVSVTYHINKKSQPLWESFKILFDLMTASLLR